MKRFSQISILCLFNTLIYAQAVEQFHLSLPETLISNSNYNSIQYLDSRLDTTDFGTVYSKHYKRKVPLIPPVNMNTQLNWLIQAALDSSSISGELLFQLRKLEFVELGGEIPSYGYCPIRVDLYVKKNSNYFLLAKLDTFIATEKGIGRIDVSELLLKQSKAALSRFILKHLQLKSSIKKAYTYDQILVIDSIEKTHLPLYNATKYTNGVYLSYESFKIQKPDYPLLKVTRKFDEIHRLTLLDKKGKKLKIDYKEVYAFVYKDTAYISDYYGCYTLQKFKNDFYFVGKGKALATEEGVALAGATGLAFGGIIAGIAGEQMTKNSAYAYYKGKIDHCDGSVIWFDKIKK
jgi:hypothetical protein